MFSLLSYGNIIFLITVAANLAIGLAILRPYHAARVNVSRNA